MKSYLFKLTDNETKVYEVVGNVLKQISLKFEGKHINTWHNTCKFSFDEGNIIFVPQEAPYKLLNQNVFLDKIYFLGFDYQKDWTMAEFIKLIAKHNNIDLKSSQLIFIISHNLFIGVTEVEGLKVVEENFCKVVPKIFKDSFESLRYGHVHILLEGLLDISVMDILHKLNLKEETKNLEFNYFYLDEYHYFMMRYDENLSAVHQTYASTSRSLHEKYMHLINPVLMNQYEDLPQLPVKIHRNLIMNYLFSEQVENFEYIFQDHRMIIPINHHSLYVEEFLGGENMDKVMNELLDYKKSPPLFFALNIKFDYLYNQIKNMVQNDSIIILSHQQLIEFENTMLYYAYYLVNQVHPFSKKSLFLKKYPHGIKDVFGDETYVYNYLSLLPIKEGLKFIQESKIYKYYKNILRPIRESFQK